MYINSTLEQMGLEKKGNIKKVEGNNPLFLRNEETVWIVLKGYVDVFIAEADPYKEEVTGIRTHLFTASTGDILFGIDPLDKRNYSLLAVGIQETYLIALEFKELLDLIRNDRNLYQELVGMINRWTGVLNKAATAGVERDSFTVPFISEEYLQQNPSLESLILYQREVFQQIVHSRKQAERAEVSSFQLKMKGEVSLFRNALMNLGTVMSKKHKTSVRVVYTGSSLYQACCMICKTLQIDVDTQHQKKEIVYSNDISVITQALRVRYRKVALPDEWWKEDNGPLLGYIHEDDRPVALIPSSPNKYKLHDPRHDTTEIVNHETAQRIKPFAYTFYSSFPIKELNIWEALFISARSLWKIDFLFIMLMGLVAGILSMILPVATGLVFDEIIPQGERMQLIFIALFLGVGAISRLMFQFVQSLSLRRIEGRIDSNMQTSVWDRLLDLPIDFFRKFSSGELAMKAINIGNIRRILSGATIISILSAIFSIPGFFLLFYYNSELALRTMPLLLLAVVATILFGKIRMSYNKQETELGNKLSGFVFQLIRGISKLRVSGSEKRAFSMWAAEFSKLRQVGYCSEMFNNAFLVFTDLLPLVSSLIIFYWISTMHSEISIGIFIAFNAAFTNVLYSVLSLADALMKITYVIPIIESADCIFKTLPEYDQTKKDPGKLAGNIEVSHVSYRYEPSAPLVLNDICLHIQSGEYLAIVGSSGCGKSTLLRILLGFQKPEVGKVYYDEQDLEELDIRKVRKQLGVVMQNSCLMPGDIFTNIVGSNINLTIDDAWEAAKLAGLDEDIRKMPMGMHTYVSEGGSTLSGGQRQRILIARAIANKPSILFFDEATSALDNKTQAVVSRSLEQLNVTRVVIAHRLSTIVNCDRIVVMDKGGIVEEGTYEELISRKGVFAEMAERQLA